MKKMFMASLISASALTAAFAHGADHSFNRIASFATPDNMQAGEDKTRETAPEIISATADGEILVYTDSLLGALGLIDITDPAAPKPLGNIALNGEPTSVVVLGRLALVGVNTSESFVDPSGRMDVINIDTKEIAASCDLGGQPDSLALAGDGSFVAVAIENERDEDLNDGAIPQAPPGTVTIFDIENGAVDCASIKTSNLTGLAEVAPSDPEPEFVDINDQGEIVVTLQENNHIVVLDRDGSVVSHFSAGSVDLRGIDVREERAFVFDGVQIERLREPDAVKWIDNEHVATANEGDYTGGSRGWTIFRTDGTVVFESDTSFERAMIEIGHYPERRSENKGVEPESIETAVFRDDLYIFVGSERGSIVGVYRIEDGSPTLKQLLPSGIAPEGIVAIPSRGLLVTANEEDLIEDGGVRAHVMIYELQNGPPIYPTLTSEGAGRLIGWTAISGMVSDPDRPGLIYAVNDAFMRAQPRIYTINANTQPARITNYVDVTLDGAPAQELDMTGITTDGAGGFWIASKGHADGPTPHALYRVSAAGEITQEVVFPDELLAAETGFGAEGVTRVGDVLWIALEREWRDDPEHHVKLVSYNTETGDWGAVLYPKAAPEKGWTGLSEITAHGDHVYIVERDNQIGAHAVTKKLYRVPLIQMTPTELGGDLPVVEKELVRDLLPDLQSYNGYVQDKVEGFAIDSSGMGYVSTNNDGVDDHSGETFFWKIGRM